MIIPKNICKTILLFIFASFFALGCGGGAEIRILVPIDGPNPFQTMEPNKATAAMYFRFMELRSGYTNMRDVITGADVWYPAQSGSGIDPFQTGFSIDEASLDSGKHYRVEIWAKNNSADSAFQYYGYPDCPLVISSGTGTNICFGDYIDDTTVRNCIGMKTFAECSQ